MPVYTYKGYDSVSGAVKKGKVEAENPKAARQKLKQKDKIIVSEIKEETSLEHVRVKTSVFASKKVKVEDLSIMTRQFATLIKAQIPVDESLMALTNQVDNMVLRNTLSAMKDIVSEGKSLAEAAGNFPGVFSKLFVNMVGAGESSGTLGVVLERLADYLEYQVAVRGKIIHAMTYPAVMITAMLAIIAYLFTSIVPKLQKVFQNMKITLPWYTKMLIGISEFIQNYWWAILGAGLLVVFGFRGWVATKEGRQKFDSLLLRLPLFGSIILRINVSRFTRTLSTLLNSGVPIMSAMEITRNIVTNSVISGVVEEARVAVQEGKSLGHCISKTGQFPPLVSHMIATGEKTGQLEEMLGHVSAAYDAEVERKISSMIALLEPLMIIMMAGVAVLVIVGMMVPMLQVMNSIHR